MERGVKIYGYVQLGTSIIMVPVSYVQRLKAIPADASPGERAALAAEAFLDAANQSLQLAVTAAQMIEHASTPASVGGRGSRTSRRPGRHPPVEQRPPGEQHPPAEERGPAGRARTGEPARAGEQARVGGSTTAWSRSRSSTAW